MTLLAPYDTARAALAAALQSKEFTVVKASRIQLEHLKLHARLVKDRALLVEACECQMKVERWLGMLLARAEADGLLRARGQRGKAAAKGEDGAARPATRAEIGIDNKLSMTAKRAADLDQETFEAAIAGMRTRMRSGKAILVDPVQAQTKQSELDGRRAAHAARTLRGGCVKDLGELALSGFRAKFVGSDPQWQFLTRSAAGEGRSANVHYKTEAVEAIKALPVGECAADDSMFGMWMVDWCPQDALDLMRHYGFTHVTTLYTWIKTNGIEGKDGAALDIWDSSTWHLGQGFYSRANPESCWLGTKGNPKRLYADVRQLIVAPIMEHSRKPDEWLVRSERLSEGPFLELQARRPRPGWVSWGDELEFTGVAA